MAKADRTGSRGTTLIVDSEDHKQDRRSIGDLDHRSAATFLIDWLEQPIGFASISAVRHRVVNGGSKYHEPQRVAKQLLDDLRRISAYAPEHLPSEIDLIDVFREWARDVPQVVWRALRPRPSV